MKPYFKTPITSLDQAYRFFYQLWRDGLLFHPEDPAETIVRGTGPEFLFTQEEAEQLNARIMEVYQFDLDPCAFCLGLSGSLEGVDDRNKPAS